MSIDVDKRPVQENGIQERENIGTASNIYTCTLYTNPANQLLFATTLIRVWPDKFWFAAANIRDQDDDYLVNNTLETFEDWSATRKKNCGNGWFSRISSKSHVWSTVVKYKSDSISLLVYC